MDKRGGLANAFVYIEKGLEGKQFEVPQAPVVIDQNGQAGYQAGKDLVILLDHAANTGAIDIADFI